MGCDLKYNFVFRHSYASLLEDVLVHAVNQVTDEARKKKDEKKKRQEDADAVCPQDLSTWVGG